MTWCLVDEIKDEEFFPVFKFGDETKRTLGQWRIGFRWLASGENFFTYFQRFEGKVKNTKLQIPLPGDFFD